MQTFLPYKDFDASAKCLDSRRLSKQIVECQQILSACVGTTHGWSQHPAVRMWQCYEATLRRYAKAMYDEFFRRYCNFHASWETIYSMMIPVTNVVEPPWLGDERLHRSHRSRLWQKNPAYYAQFKVDGVLDLPYWWPNEIR